MVFYRAQCAPWKGFYGVQKCAVKARAVKDISLSQRASARHKCRSIHVVKKIPVNPLICFIIFMHAVKGCESAVKTLLLRHTMYAVKDYINVNFTAYLARRKRLYTSKFRYHLWHTLDVIIDLFFFCKAYFILLLIFQIWIYNCSCSTTYFKISIQEQ